MIDLNALPDNIKQCLYFFAALATSDPLRNQTAQAHVPQNLQAAITAFEAAGVTLTDARKTLLEAEILLMCQTPHPNMQGENAWRMMDNIRSILTMQGGTVT